MMLPKFEFCRASTVEEALAQFRRYDHRALFLAGGTDLTPRMKLMLEKPVAVIDIKAIPELTRITEADGWMSIGAGVTLAALLQDPMVREYAPVLAESLACTSCESLRFKGTIGGNLLQQTRCLFYNHSEFWRKARGFCVKMGGVTCNAVPGAKMCFANYCSDNAPALFALAAQVKTIGPAGERFVPLGDLFTGKAGHPFNLAPGEILSEILVPINKTRGGYEKLRVRGSIDYPLMGVAMSFVNGGGRLAVGAIGANPLVFEVPAFSEEAVTEAAEKAGHEARPVANAVLMPKYRKRMIPVLAKRLVRRLLEETR